MLFKRSFLYIGCYNNDIAIFSMVKKDSYLSLLKIKECELMAVVLAMYIFQVI